MTLSVYRVEVTKKLEPRQLKHTVVAYHVLAHNEKSIRATFDEPDKILFMSVKKMVVVNSVGTPLIIGGPSYFTRDRDIANRLLGIVKPVPKASKSRKNAPLGETQWFMLKSLHEYGPWVDGCGWLWNTISGTKKILNGLVRRELVSLSDEGRYHLTAAGRQKLLDRANAAAYHGVDND